MFAFISIPNKEDNSWGNGDSELGVQGENEWETKIFLQWVLCWEAENLTPWALKKAFRTFLLHWRGHIHCIAQFLEWGLHFQKLVKMFILKKKNVSLARFLWLVKEGYSAVSHFFPSLSYIFEKCPYLKN